MRISLKLSSTLFLAVLLLLSIGILSLLVMSGIQKNQQAAIEQELAQQVKLANLYIRQDFYADGGERITSFLKESGNRLAYGLYNYIGIPVTIYSDSGVKIGNSAENGVVQQQRDQQLVTNNEEQTLLEYALDNKVAFMEKKSRLLYMAPIDGPDGQSGAIQLDYSLVEVQAFRQEMKRLFFIIGLGVLAAAFASGFMYYSRIAAAVLRLKLAADQIRGHQFIAHSPVERRDELGELGEGIAVMSRELENGIQSMEREQRHLRLAVEKLQKLERQQKQFIGSISHEFKTPLTSIKAYIELVGMYQDDPQLLKEAYSNIDKETGRLYEMVEKVLQLSALERYEFEIQAESFDAKSVIEDLAGRMRGKAERFGIALELNLAKTPVWCDKEAFVHMLVNLIDNAIKYNRPGGFVRLKCRPQDSAIVEVEDNGIGIPPELLKQIFEPFYTVIKDRSRESGGTGLGLSLVRELANKQGGEVYALPRKGGGMVFRLHLPLYSQKD
ncbi:HAMP domain-containing histidine kinase [Paenibacillus pasadenensis]|uniref:sensor histidine kinase n=1 Tax=Paenibacillus pasadenensis TaxID=217090 RepID=UPI00203F11DE|nr:HAMP domain-containing sensor histidine kinase [Paenibacillus pasadenensis]MCM3749413.1 HAMP domain-containing histidine kinase [Paenibacillus pasadenensis]